MRIGILGLGRMGANIARRLLRAGHQCVVFDRRPEAGAEPSRDGAEVAPTLAHMLAALQAPRIVWIMLPAGAVDAVLDELRPRLEPDDILIDGGNSYYQDTIRRAAALRAAGVHLVDAGTSGGIWGLEQGYCLMLGGETAVVRALEPIFRALAPGATTAAPGTQPALYASAELGYLHCGPSGAGHFVKMVHNGIEYGLMAAYAEGMNLLQHARAADPAAGGDTQAGALAGLLRADLDLGAIAELWRRGSVVRSWLLDLTARALARDPELSGYQGHVADSGEGRWTIKAGIDAGVPLPVLSAALYARFSSRGRASFADKLLSALRAEFGGHVEPKPGGEPR
ncbi:MAG: decarboxylating 6-phosphogluconate dehydrogenase [Burkholderiales bacterium]|nr:decarboxylating 6-phosphogluconate dehydrogenase [Burkholderiales bacterium]